MANFLYSLEKAAADPEVKNFVIDITNNPGGYDEVLVAIYSLVTGKRVVSFTSENTLTGQPTNTNDYSLFYNLDELRLAATGREKEPRFRTHSLLLSGTIGVNFYMHLPENEDVDYSKSFVDFTVNGKTRRQAFDKNRMNKDRTLYGFTCPVNVAQMADEITAVFHYFT